MVPSHSDDSRKPPRGKKSDRRSEKRRRSAGRDRPVKDDDAWRWRLRIARLLAAEMDADRLGVKAVYLFGSTRTAEAGPGSDIDLLIHIVDDPVRRARLERWFASWDARLCEVLRSRTGEDREHLLDLHFVTDEDIARGDSFALHIDAMDHPARKLPLGKGGSGTKPAEGSGEEEPPGSGDGKG